MYYQPDTLRECQPYHPGILAARAPRAAQGEVHHLHPVRSHVRREPVEQGRTVICRQLVCILDVVKKKKSSDKKS
jgi:hypothetical protein